MKPILAQVLKVAAPVVFDVLAKKALPFARRWLLRRLEQL